MRPYKRGGDVVMLSLAVHDEREEYHEWMFMPLVVEYRDRLGRPHPYGRMWYAVLCNNVDCPAKLLISPQLITGAVDALLHEGETPP